MKTAQPAMALDDVLQRVGIPEAEELFAPDWEASAVGPPEAVPFFLDAAWIAEAYRGASLPEAGLGALLAMAAEVRRDRLLRLFVWHAYRLLFERTETPPASIARWPFPERVFGERAGLLYHLVRLGAVGLIRESHRARGIPEQITRETSRLAGRVAPSGILEGPNLRTLYWLRNHARGLLFRLGRFEYRVYPFPDTVRVFREKRGGRVLALLNDGIEYNEEGFIDHPDIRRPGGGYRRARFAETKADIRGVPVHPAGRVLPVETVLPAAGWEAVLRPGDPMLDIHIPGGGHMTLETSHASMRQALDFFPRYVPDRPFKGFMLQSWTCSAELESLLPAESNLVRFLRQVYLYPRETKGTAGLFFLFGEKPFDLRTAPRDTSLQRAILRHLEAGGLSREGGMFLLPEHLDLFGETFYRNQDFRGLFPGASRGGD